MNHPLGVSSIVQSGLLFKCLTNSVKVVHFVAAARLENTWRGDITLGSRTIHVYVGFVLNNLVIDFGCFDPRVPISVVWFTFGNTKQKIHSRQLQGFDESLLENCRILVDCTF